MPILCKAPCIFRTYGKWRRIRGTPTPNPDKRDMGTCSIAGSGAPEISEDKVCLTFMDWDEAVKEQR